MMEVKIYYYDDYYDDSIKLYSWNMLKRLAVKVCYDYVSQIHNYKVFIFSQLLFTEIQVVGPIRKSTLRRSVFPQSSCYNQLFKSNFLDFNRLKPTGNSTYHKDYNPKILHCNHMEFVYFVWISEQISNLVLQNIKRLVFITEVESVYCALRTLSLYNTDTFRL
jgi:hypothetical protein